MRGGYGRRNLSPKLNTKLAQVLVEAANHNLANSTWSNYQSACKLTKITWETGIAFHYPMTGLMCQTIVGWFMSRGLRATTILLYMAGRGSGGYVAIFGEMDIKVLSQLCPKGQDSRLAGLTD